MSHEKRTTYLFMIRNLEEIIKIADAIPGWYLPGDMIAMHSILQQHPESINFLEIGSWVGRSTTSIGLSLPLNSRLVCVDTFLGSENEQTTGHIEAQQEGDKIYKQFIENIDRLKSYRPDLNIEIIRGDSRIVYTNFEKLEFNIIFIDGNHTFQYVKQDFFNLYPYCKDDGMIVGHDFHQGCPGVIKFVTTFLTNKFKLYPEKESCIWSVQKEQLINEGVFYEN